MSNTMSKVSYHFVFFLFLYEFSVYISNDMIMPAMIYVIRDFNVSTNYIPSALSLYMLGGSSLQLFVGPFAEKYGKKKILLIGVLLFIFATAANSYALSIWQFLGSRIFQGMGIAFISTIGYATIQELYPEKKAVKIISIMTSLAILAPLFGPILGSIFLKYHNWRNINLIIIGMSLLSFIGLSFTFPKSKKENIDTNLLVYSSKCYINLLKNYKFIFGVLSFSFAQFPLLLWIAVSPILLIQNAKLNSIEYGYLQFPVFGGFIIGVLFLQYLLKKLELQVIIKISALIILLGMTSLFIFSSIFLKGYYFLLFSLGIYAIGLGTISSPLFRLVIFSANETKTSVTALFSFINMILISTAIEYLSSYINTPKSFGISLFIVQFLFLIMLVFFLKINNSFKISKI